MDLDAALVRGRVWLKIAVQQSEIATPSSLFIRVSVSVRRIQSGVVSHLIQHLDLVPFYLVVVSGMPAMAAKYKLSGGETVHLGTEPAASTSCTSSSTRYLLSSLWSSPESRAPFVIYAAWGMSLLETSSLHSSSH